MRIRDRNFHYLVPQVSALAAKTKLKRLNSAIAVPDNGFLTNLVPGDFAVDGSTGWGSLSTATLAVSGDALVATGNGSSASIYLTYTMADIPTISDKFGFSLLVKASAECTEFSIKIADTDGTTMSEVYMPLVPTAWTDEAFIIPITVSPSINCRIQIKAYYGSTGDQNGKTLEIKFTSVCNLTAQIGAGNEPSVGMFTSWLDTLSNSYLPTTLTELFDVAEYKLMPRVGFFGDSILVINTPNTKGLEGILYDDYNCMVFNYAIGGATMRTNGDDSYITTQISSCHDTNLDYILFDGGVNDILDAYGNPTYTGSISTGYAAVLDLTTFYGAFESAVKSMLTTWVGAMPIWVSPHITSTRDLAGQVSFNGIGREICEKWGIPYADVFRKGVMNTNLAAYLSGYGLSGTDGTHPSDVGYSAFYRPVLNAQIKHYTAG
jgi:lysophospholipase L1-like esterase